MYMFQYFMLKASHPVMNASTAYPFPSINRSQGTSTETLLRLEAIGGENRRSVLYSRSRRRDGGTSGERDEFLNLEGPETTNKQEEGGDRYSITDQLSNTVEGT